MQDNVEEVLELLNKLMGELQSPLLKNTKSQLRKELVQICLKSLLQRLGKLLVDVKNSEHLQKKWEQKQFGKIWKVEKENLSLELVELFLEKVDRNTFDLAKKFLTIKNECKQNSFSVQDSTNSSLEIFDKVPVLETIMSSHTQEVLPSISLDERSFELEFETDRNLYVDMRDTYLSLKLQLFKGRLFDAFKKKPEHEAKRWKTQMRKHQLTELI